MNLRTPMRVLCAGAVCGITALAAAQPPSSTADLATQVQQLKAQVAQLQAKQNDTWLNAQRAQEVKALVKQVLSDANSRASLEDSAMTAGWKHGSFFLASADNAFVLHVGGQIDVRYIANTRKQATDVNGFELRRGKVWFYGNAYTPALTFKIQMAASRNGGTVAPEDLWFAYQLTPDIKLTFGRRQEDYAREAFMSSKFQQTVERSYVTNQFADGDTYTEGVFVDWNATDMIHTHFAFDDGLRSGSNIQGFSTGNSHFSLEGRIGAKLAGSWKSESDVEAWSDESGLQAFVGAGARYQDVTYSDPTQTSASAPFNFGAGNPTANTFTKMFQWTGDVLVKYQGFSLMAAGHGLYTSGGGATRTDDYAAEVGGGYFVIPDKLEPFVRYQWIHPDSSLNGAHNINMLTFGGNYFFKKHDAKFTLDCVWVMNPLDGSVGTLDSGNNGLGLLTDTSGKKNQIAIRAQFQLLF